MKTRKALALLMTAAALLGLLGCANRHKIIVSNKKEWSKIKSSYQEGENVVLYYQVVATDSDLSIVVDGQPAKYEFISGYGFRIEFAMPDHDVEIKCIWTADPHGA
ncbi:MAG: hypothetical protein IKX74_04860 [Erysipelotrichaceae bacterium]|nr:hypothetical protein [Erysipelotrichaceae bacterium]MBR5048951.1 hypothetical protein [Erysipelotrichaceae bacterium]